MLINRVKQLSPEVPIIILILAIPIYFICKWIIKRLNFGTKKSRRLIAVIPTLILSPIVYVGIILLWIFSISYYSTSDFDQKEWNSNIEERYKMSEDIIESKMLIGKTKNEIIESLGEGYSSNSGKSLTYELGMVPGLFNIDPDYLEINFKNGIASTAIQFGG